MLPVVGMRERAKDFGEETNTRTERIDCMDIF